MSTMQKYITDPRVATGRYCSRFSLISIFLSSESASFCSTSFAFAFVLPRTSINSVSSSKLPCVAESLSSSCASNATRALVFAVTSCISWARDSSKLLCSTASTPPSSCCSKPRNVTVKSITVHFALSSGEKCGFGKRDVKYKTKFESNSITVSDTVMNQFFPFFTAVLSSTGSRSGSTSASTFSMINGSPSQRHSSKSSFSLGFASVVKHRPPPSCILVASLDLIHRRACPWGSIIKEYLLDRVTMIPFWTLKSSLGSPCKPHSPIVAWSTRNATRSTDSEPGTPWARVSARKWSCCSLSRYSELKGPQ
mmetsp:Transcript_107944/g.247502  ORF Transcript_107944/g.247502 Transcript_107944/m.247502 type:complete len:310 (-) Transcript_107944:79-1008(-)